MSVLLQLADDLIAAQLRLLRVSAGERLRIARLLERVARELAGLVASTEWGRARQAQLIREAEAIIREEYRKIEASLAATLQGVGTATAGQTAGILTTAYAGQVGIAAPTEGLLAVLVRDTLIQGAPSAAWWERQAGDTAWRFAGAVRSGVAAGETNAQIVQRVRSEMDVSRRNAAALVQTSVQTVANEARREVFRANTDLVKGIRHLSTLDGNTTDICIAYSGAEWDLDGNPLPGTDLPYGNGVPRHWNCRSVEQPLLATYRELGIDLPEPPRTTRASSEGQIAAGTTFDAWLSRRTVAEQDAQLGKGRAELWRSGKITLRDLVNGDGRPLTLAQLRE